MRTTQPLKSSFGALDESTQMPKQHVAVLIPFNSDEPWRIMAYEYVRAWYEVNFPEWEIVAGSDGDHRHGWIKALAVKAALERTEAEVLVLADADCICEGVDEAAQAVVTREAKWAVPHNSIRRLSEEATRMVYGGCLPNRALKTACKVYSAVAGGGITVITRRAYEAVPLDPRFHTTHGEDVAWATALKTLVGKPYKPAPTSTRAPISERVYGDLYHLYHPPIAPIGTKFEANKEMAQRYQRVARMPDQMRQLVEGAKDWKPIEALKVRDSLTSCAVIVPVLNRPQNAAPFMESFRRAGEDAAVYAVAESGDWQTVQAWRNAGAQVLLCDRGSTFACKANYGYEATGEPWLLFVGDDVRFSPTWLEAALKAAGDEYDLVSTNDLARQDLDTLAIHPLIRRRYIKDVGASWDGPGTVAHEGFRHWFVDMEWSQAAIDRGVMTYAPDSVIEHLHPLWGKGKMDDTYRLGMKPRMKDQSLYTYRFRMVRRRIRG